MLADRVLFGVYGASRALKLVLTEVLVNGSSIYVEFEIHTLICEDFLTPVTLDSSLFSDVVQFRSW